MEAKRLTPRQKEIFNYIKEYIKKYNYAPTYEEIGTAIGLSSMATIFTHVKTLEKKGYIKRQKGVSRGIEVLVQEEATDNPEVQIPLLGYITGVAELEEFEDGDAKFTVLRKDLKVNDLQSCFVLQIKGNGLLSEALLGGDYLVFEYKNEVKSGDEALVVLERNVATIRRVIYNEDETRLESITDPLRNIRIDNPVIRGKLIRVYRIYS